MFLYSFLSLVTVSCSLVQGAALRNAEGTGAGDGSILGRQQQNDHTACLDPAVIQSASTLTGQEKGTKGVRAGQSPSKIDDANFINFCSGYPLTNGQQLSTSTCNGIPMGRLPAKSNMISSIITHPLPGARLPASTPFNITVQTRHLRAGFLVNPSTSYYTAPQDLDEHGDVIGHCHITVQDIGSLDAGTPPDPGRFAFFKGVDDAGDGKGLLRTTVDGGLPAGVYRVCTMIAARNHQPVTMPVAQRGAQDDCTKFEVVDTATE